MFTHILPWLVAGLATRITLNYLLHRWRSTRLELSREIATTLIALTAVVAWQYDLTLPLGLIVGVFLMDLLRGRS